MPIISKNQIVSDLKDLGITNGDCLMVHSSLSSIGFVEGGPDTVIDALLEVLGPDGTLVMPCLFWVGSIDRTLKALGGIFDPKTTPTILGRINETFRKRPGVYRSIHPTHSVCAFGAKAKLITEGHEKCNTTFGKGTPWYKLMELNGKILMLGVGEGQVTFYHVIEDVVNSFPVKVYDEKEYVFRVIDNDLKKTIMKVKAHNPEVTKTRIDAILEGEWIRSYFRNYLTSRGFVNRGYIGGAKSWVIGARDLFEAQNELLEKNITIYTTKKDVMRN